MKRPTSALYKAILKTRSWSKTTKLEKISVYYAKTEKKVRVTILILDKEDFKLRNVTRNKDSLFIRKGSCYQEDIKCTVFRNAKQYILESLEVYYKVKCILSIYLSRLTPSP